MFRKNQNENTEVKKDLYLIERIQPAGGISFSDEKYVSTGTGYEACIHIFSYKKKISDHWLKSLTDIENTIVTLDVKTNNIDEVKRNLNRSMDEQDLRWRTANTYAEVHNAKERYNEMKNLYDEICSMGEIVKLLHVRIFVADPTIAGLQEKVKTTITALDSAEYKAAVFLNESKEEWLSMFQSYSKQEQGFAFLNGQPLPSFTLAGGNPFHYSNLEDPYGTYFGSTPCGGNVIFNLFHKDTKRLYYNGLEIGNMGSGKSSLLKKLAKAQAIQGDFIRIFDISGEFANLTHVLGGKIIQLDGRDGMLNQLEILSTSENESLNYIRHMSKLTTIYRYLVPEADRQEIMMYQNVLTDFYETIGLSPTTRSQITKLPASSYPTYSDLLEFLNKKMEDMAAQKYKDMERTIATENLLILNKIKNTISYLVNTYGSLFDGHTSIDNITDEQIVTFDISKLKEMEPAIFDVQIFNAISLCWDNCVTNGKLMESMRREGSIQLEDIVHFLILIDESHRWINTQKLQALDLITIYLREARKYYGGIVMASQSIRDYVPEGSSDVAINKIKTVFELTQYKFLFYQDNNTLPLLDMVFGNQLTYSQKQAIPRLEQGETILAISGGKSLKFKVYLTKEEERIFDGGL